LDDHPPGGDNFGGFGPDDHVVGRGRRTGCDKAAGAFNFNDTNPACARRGGALQMTERRDVDGIAPGDLENGFTQSKGKFIPINADDVFIGHDEPCTPLRKSSFEEILFIRNSCFCQF